MRDYETTKVIDLQGVITEIPHVVEMTRCAIYRGQADKSWSLQPSLFRDGVARSRNRQRPDLEWNGLLSELEWTSHATARGIPTQFSSWSDSPIAAMWRATRETEDCADGALWRIIGQLNWIWRDEDYDPTRFQFYRPQRRTDSMEDLQTCFMLHPLPDDGMPSVSFENWYVAEDDPNLNLAKIIIPHEAKGYIWNQIRAISGMRQGCLME